MSMDTAFTEEHDEVRRTLRELLARRCGPDDVDAAVGTAAGHDEALWRTLAGQLGLPGLTLPEEYGGAGGGAAELALVFEEAGRALLPSPLLATTALAAPLVATLGTPAQRRAVLPALASGRQTAALAVPAGALPVALGLTGGTAGPWNTRDTGGTRGTRSAGVTGGVGDTSGNGEWAGGGRAGGMQARRDQGSGEWRLYGECGQVLGGHSAEILLIAAHTGGFARSRTLLFLVRGDARGLSRARQTALDGTRAVARLELREVSAGLLGDGDGDGRDVCAALTRLGPRVAAALAAEAVGAADSALARTVASTKSRERAGRPEGSFETVRRRLADVYVQVRAARSAAYYAAWVADADAGAGPGPGRRAGGANKAGDGGTGARPSAGLGTGRGTGTDAGPGTSAEAGPGAETDAATAGGLALAQGLEALRLAAGEAVQSHGGCRTPEREQEAQRYFRRAAGDDLLFGPVHRLRAHAAERAALFTSDSDTESATKGNGQSGPEEGSERREAVTA